MLCARLTAAVAASGREVARRAGYAVCLSARSRHLLVGALRRTNSIIGPDLRAALTKRLAVAVDGDASNVAAARWGFHDEKGLL